MKASSSTAIPKQTPLLCIPDCLTTLVDGCLSLLVPKFPRRLSQSLSRCNLYLFILVCTWASCLFLLLQDIPSNILRPLPYPPSAISRMFLHSSCHYLQGREWNKEEIARRVLRKLTFLSHLGYVWVMWHLVSHLISLGIYRCIINILLIFICLLDSIA